MRQEYHMIFRIYSHILNTVNAFQRPRKDPRWTTRPNEDRYLTLLATRNRNLNRILLQHHCTANWYRSFDSNSPKLTPSCTMYTGRSMVWIVLTTTNPADCREMTEKRVSSGEKRGAMFSSPASPVLHIILIISAFSSRRNIGLGLILHLYKKVSNLEEVK